MRIIVCIKQVPDSAEVRVDPETGTLVREGVPAIINPFDENAIEAALRLRELHGGEVIALSMGPPQAQMALRRALAMGVDKAYLLGDRAFAGSDTLATGYALSQAVRYLGEFDLILCGRQSIDGDTAQVGPGLAEHLGIAQVTCAIELEIKGCSLLARRVLDDGFELVEADLPCLATVVKHINFPRHIGLRGLIQAHNMQIPVLTAQQVEADSTRCGLQGSPTSVVQVFTPKRAGKGELLTGEVSEAAHELVRRLKAEGLVGVAGEGNR